MPNIQISASIVLYHNDIGLLKKAIDSFLNTTLNVKLYLIDNSSTDDLKTLKSVDQRIEYIFNNANLGYGAGHNIAIRKNMDNGVAFHLVLNPDVYFEAGTIEKILEYMQKNEDTGHLMPKVLYPNGDLQYLCRLLPTAIDLFVRRFVPIKSLIKKIDERYELTFFDYKHVEEIPFLSGCFMFLRTDTLKKSGLFDEKFFMYMEDADLTRRIGNIAKTVVYPEVTIYHEYQRGAHKSKRLLWIFIHSVFIYFNKYGWFFDKVRRQRNNNLLRKLGYFNK